MSLHNFSHLKNTTGVEVTTRYLCVKRKHRIKSRVYHLQILHNKLSNKWRCCVALQGESMRWSTYSHQSDLLKQSIARVRKRSSNCIKIEENLG